MDEIDVFLNNLNKFKEFLVTNNFFKPETLSELLKTTEDNDSETQFKLIIEDIESREQEEIERFAVTMRNSELVSEDMLAPTDQSDNILVDVKSHLITRLKEILMSPKVCGQQLVVRKAHKIKSNKYGDVYHMISSPRGFCIIIDNQHFAKGFPYRAGSRADADRLYDVFSQLDFDVRRYNNRTSDQMKTLLFEYSQNEALIDHDAMALIILSHGTKDGIYGSDGDVVNVDTILEYFNNENCLFLRNKPKMFFLSACRGVRIDSGSFPPIHFTTTRSLGRSSDTPNILPTWSDMFVYYSTISGYASLRNTTTGSWFGYELAHCLAEFAHREHLHDLVTIKVGEQLQKRETEIKGNFAKQSIETQTKGSVKKLYFNPGQRKVD